MKNISSWQGKRKVINIKNIKGFVGILLGLFLVMAPVMAYNLTYDSAKNELSMNYDGNSRILNQTSENSWIVYSYDVEVDGTLTNISNNEGVVVRYEYDDRKRVVKEIKDVDGKTFAREIEYDSMDRETYVGGVMGDTNITYGNNRLINEILGIVGLFYNERGQTVNKSFDNGLVSDFSYNRDNFRLERIETGDKQNLAYSYDNYGNVKDINDSVNSRNISLNYDGLHRLIFANIATQENKFFNYTYNSIGNLLNASSNLYNLTYLYTSLAHAPNSIDGFNENVLAIEFDAPTPDNGSNQTDDNSIYIKISSSGGEGDHYTLLDFDSDLTLWMRMDDTNSSGDPTDISTYSRNGSARGNAVQSTEGKFGDSFVFDGDGDYIEIPNANGGNMTEATISLWVNFDDYNQDQSLIYRAFGHGLYPRINFVNASGNLYLQYQLDGVAKTVTLIGFSSNYSANTWHHIVATFDNSEGVRLYVNGELGKNDSATGSVYNGGTSSTLIGRDTNLNYNMKGDIDEVLMFSRSLSQQEVKALYSASVNQYENNFTDLDAGQHEFIGHAVDEAGNRNSTELRIVNILSATPEISFESPTPANGSQQTNADFIINVSVSDTDDYYVLTDIDNDLRLWMRFDDLDSGGNPYDLSTYSNNGTLEGAIIDGNGYWSDGGQFDGIDDIVNLSKPESLQFDNEGFTIGAWVKKSVESSNNGRIIAGDSGGAGTHGFRMSINTGTDKWFFNFADGTSGYGVHPNTSMTEDWTFVVGQYNGTDNIIYVNGVKDNNNPVGEVRPDWSQVPEIAIGGKPGTTNFFNGSVDEVIIFKRVLGEDEIMALYSASANQYSHNFPKMSDGIHNFIAHAVDESANMDSTEMRTMFIDNLDLNALEVVYSAGTERVFRFLINNTLGSSISGVNWKIDTGENTESSGTSIDLTSGEEGYIFVYHNYSSTGNYRIRVTAESSQYIDTEDLIITI